MNFDAAFYPPLVLAMLGLALALITLVTRPVAAKLVLGMATAAITGAAIGLLTLTLVHVLQLRAIKGPTPFSEAVAAAIADPNTVYDAYGQAVTFSSAEQIWAVSEGNRVDMNEAYFAVEYTAVGRADDGRVYRFGGSVLYRVVPGDQPLMEQVMVRDLVLIEAPKNGLGRPRRM